MVTRYLCGRLPKDSFFLFGPRQVGKSTLLKKEKADLSVNLLLPELQLAYNKNPGILLAQAEEIGPRATVLVDEVQRVPKLLDVVHAAMERNPGLRFILCGSSARKLRHGGSNLLGGRALYRTMHPLTIEELPNPFQLSKVLACGTLPKIHTTLIARGNTEAFDRLRAYVITYIQEEIKAEALVRNLQGFQNFLDVAAGQYAQQVNLSAVSRECQVALSTVREYYSILEDTLIGFFLHPVLKSARSRMSHQPKFYFFDNGVTRAILGQLSEQPTPFERGRLFEQWVVQEMMRFNEYHQKDWKLAFWRTSHGAEVDVVLRRGNRLLCAVEIKHSRNLAPRDLAGLKSFHEVHPKVPCLVVAPIDVPQKLGFARVVPPATMLPEIEKRASSRA